MTPPFRNICFLLIGIGMFAHRLPAQSSPYRRVLVPADAPTASQLQLLGIFPDHAHYQHGSLVVEWSDEEYQRALQSGIHLDVLVEDLEQWYAHRAESEISQGLETGQGTPDGFHLGSMGGYLTWEEVLAELDTMQAHYPSIISTRDSIGRTAEGRAIWMVKISDNPNLDEAEPEVLYNALHHAREPISLMQLLYFMHHVLSKYGQDPAITSLVNAREMYFIPVLNPDGYVYNAQLNPNGGGMWRKNRQPLQGGGIGVDLNRNYGFRWGHDDFGSSPSGSANTYRGPSPFSEHETQAIRNLCMDRNFRLTMSAHGYGEYLVYPWGYSDTAVLPDLHRFAEYSTSLMAHNHYYPGNTREALGYAANGVFDDWMYAEEGIKPKGYGFSPECGSSQDGFWPSPSRIPDICAQQLEANLRLARLAGACIDLQNIAPAFLAGPSVHLPVRVHNAGMDAESAFQIEFSTTNPAVLSVSNPVQPVLGLASESDFDTQFELQLAPSTSPGTVIEGIVVARLNSGEMLSMPIRFQVGVPVQIYSEQAENGLSAWTGDWSVTNERSFSGSFSFTDSPFLDYSHGLNSRFSAPVIDLSNFRYASLQFKAFWEIDHAGDYVQIEASTDGSNFVPLAGRHTWLGNGPQQPIAPLYDSRRYGWQAESIDLSAYDGGPLFLRFMLHTNAWGTRDGFYFDDFEVYGFTVPTSLRSSLPKNLGFLAPNPSEGTAHWVPQGREATSARIEVLDMAGKPLWQGQIEPGRPLDLQDLAAGIYFYRITSEDGNGPWLKWVKH